MALRVGFGKSPGALKFQIIKIVQNDHFPLGFNILLLTVCEILSGWYIEKTSTVFIPLRFLVN
jgi:hypothetical protein